MNPRLEKIEMRDLSKLPLFLNLNFFTSLTGTVIPRIWQCLEGQENTRHLTQALTHSRCSAKPS